MFTWLAMRARRKRNAQNLYGSIVAMARNRELYTGFDVPDTVGGRFEMLVLHMFVFLERLKAEEGAAGALPQDIVDLFFADMDTTSRQLGVGDLSVPKKMRGLASAYTQRMETYKAAAGASGGEGLARALQRNVFDDTDGASRADALAGYVQGLRRRLGALSIEEIESGRVNATATLEDRP